MSYEATRDRVETYFDKSATKVWERLTSDAPVSGIRATVRAGRDRMRDVMLNELPSDLTGLRILDAGCGTGAMSVELATRGADVVAVDIAPELIKIAEARCPDHLRKRISFQAGDMMQRGLGANTFVDGNVPCWKTVPPCGSVPRHDPAQDGKAGVGPADRGRSW